MSPEKQVIAIAEACGWRHEVLEPINFDKIWLWPSDLPDYLSDLNAMNEAEKILTWQQRDTMSNYLRDGRGGYFAEAPQRAESFLRTIGKWEESQ